VFYKDSGVPSHKLGASKVSRSKRFARLRGVNFGLTIFFVIFALVRFSTRKFDASLQINVIVVRLKIYET